MSAVTLTEVKSFLQIDHDSEDDLIYSLIDAATMPNSATITSKATQMDLFT